MSDASETSETKTNSDPVREGALVALAAAEAAGAMTAELSPDPKIKAGGAIAAAIARLISGIIERHGAQGAAAAKKLLEELHAKGPQGITDAQLAGDDAKLLEEIRGWYAKPPANPFEG